MGGGGTSKTTTNTIAQPWSSAQPALRRALKQARGLYNDGSFTPDVYGGDRVAAPSWATYTAGNMIRDEAQGGTPLVDRASGALTDMMSGSGIYRDLDKVKAAALGSAVPAAASMFSGSGMLNSSTAMDAVGRAATEAVAPIEYGAWGDAQSRRLAAAGMAPSLQSAGYLPAQMLGQVGAGQDAYNQNVINADMARFDETSNAAANGFERYLSSIMGLGGMGGSQQSSGTAPGTSTAAKIGGAGLGALGTYGALAATPAAPLAIPGAILAGLMGLV